LFLHLVLSFHFLWAFFFGPLLPVSMFVPLRPSSCFGQLAQKRPQEPVFPFSVHRHSTQRPRFSFRFQVLVSAADDAFGDFVSRRIMLPLKDFSFSYLTKECDSLISMSDFLIGQEISQPWSCHPWFVILHQFSATVCALQERAGPCVRSRQDSRAKIFAAGCSSSAVVLSAQFLCAPGQGFPVSFTPERSPGLRFSSLCCVPLGFPCCSVSRGQVPFWLCSSRA
jgi:hypothetical protein